MAIDFVQMSRRVELFRGLDPEDIKKIFHKGWTERVVQGDALFYKGTTGNSMYVVLSGKLGVFDGEQLLAALSVGATVGEMSLLNGEARTATVKALEDTMVFRMDENTFKRLLSKKVAVQMLLNMSATLSKRLADTNLRLRESQGR